jgi:Zn-dependent protease
MRACGVQRWSIGLGRWWGIPVRLHIFFILIAILALAFNASEQLTAGILTVVVLLASLLLHEAAHSLAAIRVGGKVDMIVVGPMGGLVSPRVPDEPEIHLFVAMAGPIVHLTLVVLAAVALALSGHANILGLLHLSAPVDLTEGGDLWITACKLTLWLNWMLLLLNLLPVYPFDGGPILRSVLWPALGRRTAQIATARLAMLAAVVLCLVALATSSVEIYTSLPLWIPLVTLGIFLFFSAQQDLAFGVSYDESEELGCQLNGDGLDLEDAAWAKEDGDEAVLVEHRHEHKREQHRRALEAYEDARVDDILARLHDSSLSELSPEELDLLRKASDRYKQRHRPQDQA